jgi:class 3 adenylate cyclase
VASADLVTIVFTDWVGSTATRVRLGEDRADELQRIHDHLLREVIGEHRGTVVKGSGDGVLATFESATDALAASVAVQQRFDEYSRQPDAITAVQLRVGISVGDVVHQDGDIFGTPVVEAKRLEEAADTGQVLCSELVRLLARGRGGYDFDVIGLLNLKGLPEPVAACAVKWERGTIAAGLALPLELTTGGGVGFVGRKHELDESVALTQTAEQAHAVWVLGEPGIGKTRLATEIATVAHAAGAAVLFGRCDEEIKAPLQPVIQALRWFAGQVDDERLATGLGFDPGALANLVPEITSRLPGLDTAPSAPTEAEQYRLFDAVRSWLHTSARDAPVVFVVDDVQWADGATLGMLGHILRSPDPARLLVVGTARDTDPDSSEALASLVDDLDRQGRSRRIQLTGLTTEEIWTLVEAAGVSEGRPRRLAEDLAAETAGNPLFVGAVLAGLHSDDDNRDETLPADVRVAVRRRVRRLSEPTRDMLQVAAVVGLEFGLATVVEAASVSEADGLTRVEQAIRSGLVAEVAIDRFRFTHALVRDALVDELGASRRARVHAAVARALESRTGGVVDDDLHALAHHYARAGDDATVERALDCAVRSAQRALRLLSFDTAAVDYALAVELSARMRTRPASETVDLLIAKGEAERKYRAHRASMATLRSAAELARDAGDWDRFASAALAYEEAVFRPGFAKSGASALLAEAIEHQASLPPAVAIRVRSSLGRSLHYDGDSDGARALTSDVLADARAIDDPRVLAHALMASIQTSVPVTSATASTVADRIHEAWDLFAELDEPELMFILAQYGVGAGVTLGDRAEIEWWRERMDDVARRAGTLFALYILSNDRHFAAFLDGDLELAEALAEDCAALAEQLHEDVSGIYGGQLFLIRREQDRLRELVPLLRAVIAQHPAESIWQPGLVLVLAEAGLHVEALERLEVLTADGCARLPRDDLLPGVLCLLAEAAFLVGARHVAPVLSAELSGWDSAVTSGHSLAYLGSVHRYKGLLAELQGRLDDATVEFETAVAFERRMRAPVYLARALLDSARLRQRLGDVTGAGELAAEAASLAARHGLAAVRRRLGELDLL